MMRNAGLALALALATLAWKGPIAPAQAASCGEDVQRLADQYGLSLSPEANASAPGAGRVEAPATTESRGLAAGADSLSSSGGTLPPDRTEAAPKPAQGTAPAKTLGATDRAKLEGLLSDARSADNQGHSDLCRQHLLDAEAAIRGAGG